MEQLEPTLAAIAGAVAVIAAPLLAIVQRLTKIREKAEETHVLVNNQNSALQTKLDVRDATIAALQAQLASGVPAAAPSPLKRKSPRKHL
jgi:type II secretory pathway component PulC